jgi:hypothetical protein
MKSHRPAAYALMTALLLALAGCRTAGIGNLARQAPPFSKTVETETAADLLVDHNLNAQKIQSVEAKPSVSGANRGRVIPGAGGKLMLERPRNFRLVLTATLSGTDVADIGSNDEEFWLWFKDNPDKALYFCKYDQSGESPLPAGLQPDWIIEAMGLRVVPDDEAAGIEVAPGKDGRTWVLTQRRKTPKGEAFYKETILSESTRRIVEHRILAADHKTLLARAIVYGYTMYTIPSVSGGGGGGSDEKVYLPKEMRLEMSREKMALDVSMSDVKVNRFDPKRRTALFVEPVYEDFARVNLAERIGIASGSSPASSAPSSSAATTVRETIPSPPPRVRLSNPAPIGTDGARRNRRDPAILAADLPPSYARGVEEVVGPPLPTVAEPSPADLVGRSGWRNAFGPAIER